MSKGEELIALARSKAGQWYYTNDWWARMNPDESGGTDCSGFVRWCYLQFGIDVGTWTGDESYAGYEVARGHYPYEIPWDDLQPGDLILMTANYWDNYAFNEYLCHIELYCGGGTMIGHPGGYGPQEKWAQAWMESYGCITWMVRRVFGDDDMEPHDVWEYNWRDTAPNGNMYNCVLDIHKNAQSHNVWEYYWIDPKTGKNNAPGGNMYNCALSTNETVVAVKQDVEAIKAEIEKLKIGGVSVDYDKLANKVADVIYARMKA